MVVLAIIPVFTGFLGVWQLRRLKWKVELIEELEDKLKKQPVNLPKELSSELLESLTFRLVNISGTFDYSRAIFLGPRVREGQVGCNIIVPFARSGGGGEVLVNRGFVSDREIEGKGISRRLKDAATRETKATITAMYPRIYPPNFFTPENDGPKGAWYHGDPKAMADWLSGPAGALPPAGQADTFAAESEDLYTPSAGVTESVKGLLGLGPKGESRVLPALFDEIFTGDATQAGLRLMQGLPVGRAPSIELRNQHAVYAGTWFSLSAATTIMFAVLVRRGR
ncbi:Mitochondrial protein Surfeit 1/SURF1/SHY1, required for expression of cytochrome oxidase [Ceraceosorus bombacis]|uniref:SURF1-like protein n=1 Tax=Ceraceosorus bombacis TaxID=401625 RepID=A0A0N7LA73_9BASI|nr:Mitochondrial protein Surfeit 1/SURF1/SHY1, required for expression of cytochrome oxidase [Ceraceosorus bombacis]